MTLDSSFLDRYSSTDVGGDGPDPDAWDALEPLIGHEAGVDPELYRIAAQDVSLGLLTRWIESGIRLTLVKEPETKCTCPVCGAPGVIVGHTHTYECSCIPF